MTLPLQNTLAPHYHSGLTVRLMKQEKETTPATEKLTTNQIMLHPMEGYEVSLERLQNWLVPAEKDYYQKEKSTQITQDLGYKAVLVTDKTTKKDLENCNNIRWSSQMTVADREKDLKEQTIRKRLLTDSSIALIDPLVDNLPTFTPSKEGTYTEDQLNKQNQLMDEQDKQLKQWQAQHISFPFLGVPPVDAEKVISLRTLKETITTELTTPTGSPSKAKQATKTRSGAVYIPVEVALNNTLHPVILSDNEFKKVTAVLLPNEKNLQNPLLPVQSGRDYHEENSLILTGEDAYKKTVSKVNQPYFTSRSTPDKYAMQALNYENNQQALTWSKQGIPLDVTPILRNPLAFSDTRLDWLTPKQERFTKEWQTGSLLHQESTLKPIKKANKHITEILNPTTTTAEVLSLKEAQTAVAKELKALPSVEKAMSEVEKVFWEPLNVYKPKPYQPIMAEAYLLSSKPEKKS